MKRRIVYNWLNPTEEMRHPMSFTHDLLEVNLGQLGFLREVKTI